MTEQQQKPIAQNCAKILNKCVSKRSLKILLEALAIILVFILLFIGAILWKLRTTPIDISFIKPAILKAVNTEHSTYQVDFTHIVVAWPKLEGSLKLRALGMNVKSNSTDIFSVETADLLLDVKAALKGTLAIDEVVLYTPKAHIMRDADNNFTIDIASKKATPAPQPENEEDSDTSFANDLIEMLSQTEEEATKSGNNFGYLDRFEIKDAEIIVSDHKTNMTWFLPQLNAALTRWEKGVNARLEVNLSPHSEEAENILNTEISYERNTDKIESKINVENFDVAILSRYISELEPLRPHDARFNGRFISTFDTDFNLDNAVIDISVPQIVLNLPEEYDDTKTIDNIEISGFYDNVEQKYQLDLRQLNFLDTKFSGKVYGDYEGDIYSFKTNLNTETLTLDFFKSYWPNSLKDETAATWLTEKLSNGHFNDVKATAQLQYNTKTEEFIAQDARLDFAFQDMGIDYRAPMLPISNAQGTGMMDTNKLEILVENANVEDLKLTNGKVVLNDIFVTGAGIADISLNLKGSLPTTFKYISKEPIALGDNFDFKPEDTKGDVDIDVTLNFPTIKNLLTEQVDVVVNAKLDNVHVPNAVEDKALTHGPFELKYDGDQVTLKGKGKILNRPVTLDWVRYIDETKHKTFSIINAKFSADRALRNAFDIGLDDYINGSPNVNLTYKERKNNRATIELDVDLTPAEFTVKPFKFSKPPKTKGRAKAVVILKNGEVQEIKNISINTPKSSVKNANIKFGKVGKEWDIKTARFYNTKIEKNHFNLDLKQVTPYKTRIDVDATYLDLLPFLSFDNGKKGSDSSAKYTSPKPKQKKREPDLEVRAKAKHLNTSKKNGFIIDAHALVNISTDDVIQRMELDATSGGEAVYLRYKPKEDSNQLEFRLETDNAGAFLKAFGLYDNVVGGKIVVYGTPIKQGHPNDISGHAVIDDFMVVNAPSLARLLNAMSLTGIEDLLTEDGIGFDRLESKIKWYVTDQGITFRFDKGRTSGGALGLTFEGNIHQGKRDEIDISGTIVPISFLNKLISRIPLIGDILTGGDDQGIFAATYTIKGTSKENDISINPLAVLAPGILRRILFESDVEDEGPQE